MAHTSMKSGSINSIIDRMTVNTVPLRRLLIILVGLTMTWYRKKYEFPPDAYVVSCPAYMYCHNLFFRFVPLDFTDVSPLHCQHKNYYTWRFFIRLHKHCANSSWWRNSHQLCTSSSHVFTNPEFSISNCVFFEKKFFFREKISYIGMSIPKWKSIQKRSKQTINFIEKKSGFVDSGFIKKCDELVIAPLPLPILWNPIP